MLPADQRAAPEGLVDLATGNPDPALLPPLGPALGRLADVPRLYGQPALRPQFIEFAAGELAADDVSSDHLAVASGALDGVERLLREHLRQGDRVAIEDPSMPALLDLVGALGFSPVPFAMDAEGPLPDSLSEALALGVRSVIVTPRDTRAMRRFYRDQFPRPDLPTTYAAAGGSRNWSVRADAGCAP